MTNELKTQTIALLIEWFPWLGTDEVAGGADTVEQLCFLYDHLGGPERRAGQ
jgi:hypothetical protein